MNEESLLDSSMSKHTSHYQNSDYNYKHKAKLSETRNLNSEFGLLEPPTYQASPSEMDSLRWQKYLQNQSQRMAELEYEISSYRKELRKAHK